ncbi:MAG: hypothetical protein BWK78_04100 [Thiotrichaceae bacterium IS1]|nr:MAG: hypothetical protein BWK78_04100 [Thiotrichaceae bacterium IS1]
MSNLLIDDFGFVFELGFNVGLLTTLRRLVEEKSISSTIPDLYQSELQTLKLNQIRTYFLETARRNGIIDPYFLKTLETLVRYLFFLGFHKGVSFLREYCQTLPKSTTVLYCQCDLQQLPKPVSPGKQSAWRARLDQLWTQYLGCQTAPPYESYQAAGEFLRADTLFVFKFLTDRLPIKYRILALDISLFSFNSLKDIPNLQDVREIKQRIIYTINYLRQKTAFERLAIDINNENPSTLPLFSSALDRYIEAFHRNEKNSYKMVQAGGYAYSFLTCWKQLCPQLNEEEIELHAVGLTDRAYHGMFARSPAEFAIFQKIYARAKKISRSSQQEVGYEATREHQQQQLFTLISSNFARTFKPNQYNHVQYDLPALQALEEFLKTPPPPAAAPANYQATYTETLVSFKSTADRLEDELLFNYHLPAALTFRQAHQQLVLRALAANDLLLFLTGHPGIGKTTAVLDYLLATPQSEEGFLFFYLSPRIQVNRDIIEKVNKNQGRVKDELICIYSNSTLITHYGQRPVIKYVSSVKLPDSLVIPATVPNKHRELRLVADHDKEEEVRFGSKSRTQSSNDRDIYYQDRERQGVLNTLCTAISTLRQSPIVPRNIIATATLQSLKLAGTRKTSEHLKKIFAEAFTDKELRNLDETKLQTIAQQTPHLVFMIDEIIGDSGGVEFLHELVNFVKTFGLDNYFKVKIVVADASIVGTDVIQQHLLNKEESPAKILYRPFTPRDDQPLTFESMPLTIGHRRLPATLINANSFPARELAVTYKIAFNTQLLGDKISYQTQSVEEKQQQVLVEDIMQLLTTPESGQLIVYIQDIQRLTKLIFAIEERMGNFEEATHYLIIHSRILDQDRQQINSCKDKDSVRVIFMTSSASRGITFAGVRHIFIEVPRFQVEQNLMEIVQTIYRGRGGETEAHRQLEQQTRWLTLYFHHTIYYESPTQLSERYRKSTMSMMSVLLLTRAAIKTRMYGYGNLGKYPLRIIPVGDKYIDAVGSSLLTEVKQLYDEIGKELRKSVIASRAKQGDYENALAILRGDLALVFKDVLIRVKHGILPQLTDYGKLFFQQADADFAKLVNCAVPEPYYIEGDLLIFHAPQSREIISMLKDVLERANSVNLVKRLYATGSKENYPDTLKMALRKIAKELEKIQEAWKQTDNSQQIHSSYQNTDQFVALPLPVLFDPVAFSKYFSDALARSYEMETTEHDAYRNILEHFLRLFYPLNDSLPLDNDYSDFPFLLFRCNNLINRRKQHFDRRYWFSSTDFNVVNLILSQQEEEK